MAPLKMNLLLQLLQNPKTQDILWHAGPRFFRMVSGIVGSIAVARHLGAEDFGMLSFYTAAVMTASSLVGFGALEVLTRAVAAQPQNGVLALRVILRLRTWGAILAVLIFIAGGLLFLKADLVLILAAVPLLLIPDAIEAYYFGEKKFHQSAPLRVIAALLGLMGRLGLVWWQAGLPAFAAVTVFEMGVVACGLLLMSPTRHQIRASLTRPDLFMYCKQGAPLAISALVLAFSMRIDQFTLAWLRPGVELGNYYAVLRFFDFIIMIFPSITAALLPRMTLLYETDREKFSVEMKKIYRHCYLWGLVIAGSLSLLSPWVVGLVFGEKYADASSIFRIYSLCLIFMLVGGVRAMYLIITKNTIAHLKICIFCLTFSPITIFIPAYYFGALGLAFVMPFNYALSASLTSKIFKNCREDWENQKQALYSLINFLNRT